MKGGFKIGYDKLFYVALTMGTGKQCGKVEVAWDMEGGGRGGGTRGQQLFSEDSGRFQVT